MKYFLIILFFSIFVAGFFIFTWDDKNKNLTGEVLENKNAKKEDLVFIAIDLGGENNNQENNMQEKTVEIKKMTVEDKLRILPPEGFLTDSSKTYKAKIKTTEGDILADLNAEATPFTVNNFIYLSKAGFYDDTVFHRVIKGFMIQGGDPTGTGSGGPGYRFKDELFEGEYERGTVAMANAGPNTNGSQFFIMHKDYPLPKNYVIFGKVTSGMEIVDAIAEAPVKESQGGEPSKPIQPVKIISVEIVEI